MQKHRPNKRDEGGKRGDNHRQDKIPSAVDISPHHFLRAFLGGFVILNAMLTDLPRLLIAIVLTIAASPCFAQKSGGTGDDGTSGMGNGVPTDKEMILRAQIYLDQALFGPGKIDGALGEFSYKAVVNWNFAHGYRDIYNWEPMLREARARVPIALASHKIRAELFDHVDPDLPEKPDEWEGYKYMAYRSMLELVAERFHTDESFLARLNPGKNLNDLQPGEMIVVPNVRPFKIEDVKKYQSFASDPLLSAHTVVIDTTERMSAIYDADEKMLAAFPITPGKPQFIPRGQWKVVNMATTPNFRYDKKFLEEGEHSDDAIAVPPGPNSPVGILWAGISKNGIGLHGTAMPRTIGRAQSAGCVRFANWDAIRLPTLIRPGTKVIVR
jgi:lipoprotein-anchoring transpeptidase ErfK/SrfK